MKFLLGLCFGFGLRYAWCKYKDRCDCGEYSNILKLKKKLNKVKKSKKNA